VPIIVQETNWKKKRDLPLNVGSGARRWSHPNVGEIEDVNHRRALVTFALAALLCAACTKARVDAQGQSITPPATTQPTLRLGVVPTLNQATALVGIAEHVFTSGLGAGVTLTATSYNASFDEVSALAAGNLDAAYMGPSSAIAAYAETNGGIRIVSGAAAGGSFLMTKYAIKSPGDLRGQKVAVPSGGGSEDVALRSWLKSQGLVPGTTVNVVAMSEPAILAATQSGSIAGAWVPEPWASQLQVVGNDKVFLDEASLWPNGRYPSTVLAVRTAYLTAHPDVVSNLLVGQVAANDLVSKPSAQIESEAIGAIKSASGTSIPPAVSDLAWLHVSFTNDPMAAAIATDAAHAAALGQIPSASIGGIFALTQLNDILKAAGEPQVSAG